MFGYDENVHKMCLTNGEKTFLQELLEMFLGTRNEIFNYTI